MCYFRATTGPYAQDDTIWQFETLVSIWNAHRRDGHTLRLFGEGVTSLKKKMGKRAGKQFCRQSRGGARC